jgi:hypothetical protein
MCEEHLSQADINAIGKNRGFSRREIASRTALESIFLSPVGVEKVMATLTTAEAAMLHFLHTVDKPVSVDWFERLYNPNFKSGYYTRTFTQRYQPVFKQVRTKLVRKGLLIMGQMKMAEATKMEQWRFVLPPEFIPYLPSPMGEHKQLPTPGDVRRDVARNKLLAMTGKAAPPSPDLPGYRLRLHDGRLLIGDQPFTAAGLQKWQQASWQAAMPTGSAMGEQSLNGRVSGYDTTPIEALNYALPLLAPGEWIAPEQLDDLLKIFCLHTFDTEKVCALGYKWGYLAKNLDDGRSWYRLAAKETAAEKPPVPADYLSALDEETARVDLRAIPYAALEQLNQIAYLQLKDGGMTAVPHLIRMGTAPQTILDSPLPAWLKDTIPAFAQAQKTIKSRWGKQIVHTNLHVARVKDLALRVKIEHTLKSQCVVLSDEYIAFPLKALTKVNRIVAQAGHVVKKVEA